MPRQKNIDSNLAFRSIGEKIRELRLKAGYDSYETFANDHDLDRKQYWRLESGVNLTIKSLVKVLEVHQISLKEFFNDSRFK